MLCLGGLGHGWVELFDVKTDEAELLFFFSRFEPVDYGCGVFPLLEVVFFFAIGLLTWSRMFLLILPISDLVGLMSLQVGLFAKFSL